MCCRRLFHRFNLLFTWQRTTEEKHQLTGTNFSTFSFESLVRVTGSIQIRVERCEMFMVMKSIYLTEFNERMWGNMLRIYIFRACRTYIKSCIYLSICTNACIKIKPYFALAWYTWEIANAKRNGKMLSNSVNVLLKYGSIDTCFDVCACKIN